MGSGAGGRKRAMKSFSLQEKVAERDVAYCALLPSGEGALKGWMRVRRAGCGVTSGINHSSLGIALRRPRTLSSILVPARGLSFFCTAGELTFALRAGS